MARQEFEGRSAAEAAIKACDAFGVSRSQLKYEVLSEVGEGLERVVRITAEAAGGSAPAPTNEGRSDSRGPDAENRQSRGNRGGREGGGREGGGREGGGREGGGREGGRSRGGGGRDRGGRGGERGGRGGRDRGGERGGRGGRGRRGGRDGGGRGQHADGGGQQGDGIEALLDLEIVPAERGPDRPELDGAGSVKAQRGKEILAEIIRLSGFDVSMHLVQDDAEEIHFDLRGEDEARVIGRKGETLLSLQFILNRIASRDSREEESEQVLVLDAANYRTRRRAALADLAQRLAQRAIAEGKAVRLSPMSAHDRRVFHLTLKEMAEVDTRSEGDGLYRNLLIIPAQYV